jgi:FkbM family methyltransferase
MEQAEIESLLVQHKDVHSASIEVQKDEMGTIIRLKASLVLTSTLDDAKKRENDEEDPFAEIQYYMLPDGSRIAHQGTFQTNILYPEIFDAEIYLRHGITLTAGDFVFDVGANIGLFTLFASRKCHNDIYLYAFEPGPPTYEVLSTNVKEHNINVTLCDYGLSNEPKTAPLIFFPYMSGMSGLFSNIDRDKLAFKQGLCNWLQEGENPMERAAILQELDDVLEDFFSNSRTYSCRFKTLSDTMREYNVPRIDLLKIDVEGSELDVLLGIHENDWHKIKQIVAEVHNKVLLDQITALLTRHGYHMVVVEEERSISGQILVQNEDYSLYMVYAIQEPQSSRYHYVQREQVTIKHLTVDRPLLSIEEFRGFLETKLSNYRIFSDLRHHIHRNYPCYATLPIDFVLSTSPLERVGSS